MLDINLFRAAKGFNTDVVRDSQRKRFADPSVVDRVMQLDHHWRQAKNGQEQLSRQFNQLNKDIAASRKAGRDTAQLQEQSKAMKGHLLQAKDSEQRLAQQRDSVLAGIGNLVDESVPVSRDEADNEVILQSHTQRRGLTQEDQSALLSHPELVRRLGLAELEAGQAAAGGRGYFLMGDGVMLNQALVAYGLHFLRSRGWTPVQTPYWLTGPTMARCAQLAQFDEELYRVTENDERLARLQTTPTSQQTTAAGQQTTDAQLKPEPSTSGRDSEQPRGNHDKTTDSGASLDHLAAKYLIATSEQALCALHQDSWLEPGELPVRYAGFSTCFRREAGSHGKDTLGIFRVHQFDKVEQFALTAPGPDSRTMMQQMVQNARDFYDSLGIPYRLVRIVSGALNASAASKVDLEGWFPASGAYRELVSASNCTDYQARRLGIRMRTQPNLGDVPVASSDGTGGHGNSAHVHMLNATLCASQRVICCLLENHQTPQGVKVPLVLQPFMHGQDFIPFTKPLAAAGRALLKGARSIK